MLINLTNHPSNHWSTKQLETAECMWDTISDYPFPNVPAAWEAKEINQEANEIVTTITEMNPDAVLCQGEMCMTAALVRLFMEKKIPVYAVASARQSVETLKPDGSVEKKSIFDFVKFRRY